MILSFIIINRKYIFHYYFNHHHLLTILFFFLLATHLLFLIHPYLYKNQIHLVFHSSIDLYKFSRRANKKLRIPLFYRLYIHHHTFYHHSLNIIIYILPRWKYPYPPSYYFSINQYISSHPTYAIKNNNIPFILSDTSNIIINKLTMVITAISP